MDRIANMSKKQKIIIFCFLIFQILIASLFELAHDEAYYWLYSKKLDWGYFDHPPMVAVIIRFFSFLPMSELAVRIGFIFCQVSSLLILLSLTSYQSISVYLALSFPIVSCVGIFALPDAPLLFFSACFCLALKNFLNKDSFKNILILGLVISGLLYSKYHGILMIIFTLVALPGLFKKKSFYLVAFISLVLFLPHIWWQIENNFPTIRYHFFERPGATFSLKRIAEFLMTEIFLAGFLLGPFVWYLVMVKKPLNEFEKSLKYIVIGTIIFFLISSFSKRIEANWSIFISIPLILLTHSSDVWKNKFLKILFAFSLVIVLFARVLIAFPFEVTKIKRSREFHGWRDWSNRVENLCHPHSILANNYQLASKLSFYLNKKVGALNYQSRKNQFDLWRFNYKDPTQKVCYITDKKGFSGDKIITPDEKEVLLVKNQTIEEFWRLKSDQR